MNLNPYELIKLARGTLRTGYWHQILSSVIF